MQNLILDDGLVVLAVVRDQKGNQGLIAQYIASSVKSNAASFMEQISKTYTFVSDLLSLQTKKASASQQKMGLEFVLDSISINSAATQQSVPSPSITQIRELAHTLSVQYSGKTFTEKDFDNIVHQQVLNSPDDNRNQDEVFDDTCNAILFFFLYGFIQQVFDNTPQGAVVLVYDKQPG